MQFIVDKLVMPCMRLYWRITKPKTAGARAIIVFNESVLLIKNIGSRYWSLPGGGINNGETAEACMIREVNEELSIVLEKADYCLGIFDSEQEGKRDTVTIFVVTLTNGVFKKRWEIKDAKWFSIDALPESISPATKRRIDEYLAGKKDLCAVW